MKYLLDAERNLSERRAETREKDKITKAQNDLIFREKRQREALYKLPEDKEKGRKPQAYRRKEK
jgi:hypothetical protein